MAETNLLNAIHDHRSLCQSVSYRLEGIAHSMSDLGIMEQVAEELYAIAGDLTASAKQVSQAHGLELNDRVREAQEHTGLLLKAAFDGCFSPPHEEASDETTA